MMKEWIEAFFYFLEKSAPFFQEFIKDELPSLSPYIELLKYYILSTTNYLCSNHQYHEPVLYLVNEWVHKFSFSGTRTWNK